MAKKYVPEGAFLACNKGTSPSTLRVSNHKNTTIYGVPMATELDFLPFFNLKPMGMCTSPQKWITGITCLPTTMKWEQPKEGVKINGSRMLLEDSFCNCIFGGKINIFFDRAAAVSFGVGEGKMPSEYIKQGFDWMAEKAVEGRKARDEFLPDWMKPVTGVADWFTDLNVGLVEGAVNGVVGLGETLYQVGQDPVGTAEALGGMVKDGWNAAGKGLSNAWDWGSKAENWGEAAEGAWNWASDGENWKEAGASAWEGTKKAADWVAKNPRKIGNTAGEFIPDAVAAAYTAGGSLALTGAKVAGKEALEEVGERIVREGVEEATEKVAKEGGEAIAKKTGKELIESLGDDAGDIAKVVTRTTVKPKPPFKISDRHIGNADLEDAFKNQLQDQEDAINRMKVKDWLKNREDFLNRDKKDYSKRAKEARDRYRAQELDRRISDNIINKGMDPDAARNAAKESMKGQAALHNPDGIAGGKIDDITGMGDGRVNSSIGSQWDKGRAKSIEDQLKKEYGIPPKTIDEIPDDELMNVKL